MKSSIYAFFFIVSLFLVCTKCFSQTPVIMGNPGGPGTNGTNGSGTTVDITGSPSVPFDEKLSLLLLGASLWYVSSKYKRNRKAYYITV